MSHPVRLLAALVVLSAASAWGGERLLKNDSFTGLGGVNKKSLGEYQGAGALLTADAGDYPLTMVGVDVLVPPAAGSGGDIGAYLIEVWREDPARGPIDPPRPGADGGSNPSVYASGIQLTTSVSQFNRFTFPTAIVVDAGSVFIAITEQLSTADDNTTLAYDTGPIAPGRNFFFGPGWSELDGGAQGVTGNWILRAVLQVPDLPVAVTSITPNSGRNDQQTPVTIAGGNFELTSQAFLGTNPLTIVSISPPNQIQARVPAGLTPGPYDVRVVNVGGLSATLANGFTVLSSFDAGPDDAGLPDAGIPDAGPVDGGSQDAGGEPDAGQSASLRLESITPPEGYAAEETKVVLIGEGFQAGVQVMVGATLLDPVEFKSAAVLNTTVPSGLDPGTHDVRVVNPDGKQAKLEKAFTVYSGTRAHPNGCGCGSGGPAAGVFAALGLVLLLARRRANPAAAARASSRRCGWPSP
ncbi:MAG: IPT/TIG domain-containing protein [Myxococcaceae bacterium]